MKTFWKKWNFNGWSLQDHMKPLARTLITPVNVYIVPVVHFAFVRCKEKCRVGNCISRPVFSNRNSLFGIFAFRPGPWLLNPVSIGPCAIALTIIPWPESSVARTLQICITAAFEAPWCAMPPIFPLCPEIDPIWIILPPPCLSITLAAACAVKKEPVKFIVRTRFQSSIVVSIANLCKLTPALLTKMSNRSKQVIASLTWALHWAGSAISHWWAIASHLSTNDGNGFSALARSMSLQTTLAPSVQTWLLSLLQGRRPHRHQSDFRP